MTDKEQSKVELDDIHITVLANSGDDLYVVRTTKEKYETIQFLVKQSILDLVKTNKNQSDLIKFLGVFRKENKND